MTRFLSIVVFTIFAQSTFGNTCPKAKIQNDGKWQTTFTCKGDTLTESTEVHRPSGHTTKTKKYDNQGRITEVNSWNIEGSHTYSQKVTYLENQQFLSETFKTQEPHKGALASRELRIGDLSESTRLQEWVISQSSFKMKAIRHFKNGESQASRIDVLGPEGQVMKYYEVKNKTEKPSARLVSEFTAYEPDGSTIGHYSEDSVFDVVTHLKKLNLNPQELKKRIDIYNDKSREPIVIIDTGFDIMHSSLTHKLYNSPYDIVGDGLDNDNNGRVDDSWGWQRQDDSGLNLLRDDNNIRETHSLLHTPYPVSHGTHVAALALKDLDSYGLVGFAGDSAISDHLMMAGQYIKNKNIKFVNMSFAIGYPGAPLSAPRDSFFYLENILRDNSNTLFVVAAGNGRVNLDLDLPGNENFPAAYTFANMIKVGALNTSELKPDDFDSYKVASFSKFGKKHVQIFAPGQGVVAAQSGGGTIALNGTSMAAPFVLNILLKGHQANSLLSPLQLKEVLLKTAYIPKSGRLPCESGGIVWPEKFFAALMLLKNSTSNIDEAVQKVMVQ